eukprot:SAG11_NODE_2191_length_3706_cov_2.096756_5_plen_48_part_00
MTFMGNRAAEETWPVTEDKLERLRQSFRKGPNLKMIIRDGEARDRRR